MGWMYMFVCFFDFVLAPVLWSLVQALEHGSVQVQWQPLTLQGAGLFHVAMGAVIGISAYGRTQEKMTGSNNGGPLNGFAPGSGTTYIPPGGQNTVSVSNQPTFGSTTSGNFGSSTQPAFGQPSTPAPFGQPSTPPAFGQPSTPAPFGAPPAFGASSAATAPPAFGAAPPAFGAKPSGPPAASMPAI